MATSWGVMSGGATEGPRWIGWNEHSEEPFASRNRRLDKARICASPACVLILRFQRSPALAELYDRKVSGQQFVRLLPRVVRLPPTPGGAAGAVPRSNIETEAKCRAESKHGRVVSP